MNLAAQRADLLAALDRVTRIAKPGPQAFMETLLLVAGDGALTLSCTDFDIEATVSCAAVVETAGAATVPCEAFGKLIKRLPDGPVALEVLADPLRVQVRAKRSKVNLPSLDPRDHIRFGQTEPTHRFSLPGTTLAAMMRETAFAAPANEGYGASLFGVCLHYDAETGRLCAVASNTHKLARRAVAAPEGSAGMPRALIGLKAVEELEKLGEAAGGAAVEVALSGHTIEARGAGTVLRSKLVDQVFPPYERILPQDVGARLVVHGEQLAQALARAELVATGKGSGVRLDLADGTVTVSVNGPNGAGIVDEIEGKYEAGPDSLLISATMAQEILKTIDADTVHVEVGRGRKHTVWRRPGDDALFCFMMPRIG